MGIEKGLTNNGDGRPSSEQISRPASGNRSQGSTAPFDDLEDLIRQSRKYWVKSGPYARPYFTEILIALRELQGLRESVSKV